MLRAGIACILLGACMNTKAAEDFDVLSSARSLARRIKAHPNYSNSLGEQLGIVGPEDSTDLSQSQPTLKSLAVTPGSVPT